MQLTFVGLLNRMFKSISAILVKSPSSRLKLTESRFWAMTSDRLVLGMTARPR